MIDLKVIEQALAKIRDHGANYVYFFQNLNSPDWLDPLWRAGFFRKPPDPHREGNTISYPPWVESQYLTRIVEKIPNRVAEVVCEMEDTENVRVHKDVLDISLKLSPELSSLIVPNICRLLRRTNKRQREGLGGYVLRTLADLSARHPVESVRCLKFMMAVNEERVSWYFESEKVKTILRNAFSSKDASANQIATEIQDKLLRQGMFEFRNL